MKRTISIALCVLASLAAVGSAFAQDHAATATVPFGFYVANKWVPSGTYKVTSDSMSPNVLDIRNQDSTVAILSVAQRADSQPGAGKLIFKKYGNLYFLHQILCSSCRMSVTFPNSKREKLALSREQASVSAPTEIYLALK